MKLYVVRGYEKDPEFVNLYGVFSKEEIANEIKENLIEADMKNPNNDEIYEVEEIELDKPTELYDFMIND